MFISTKRGARLAAVVGLTAVVGIVLASPASASTGTNQAFGIRTSGLIVAGPFSQANFPGGPTSDTAISATVAGLVSSGTLVTNASGTTADSTVQNLSVTLATLTTLSATAVSSECSYNSGTAVLSGSSSIAGGTVSIAGVPTITLATAPAPNTAVTVPGVASVILNRQVLGADGTLTVDAIYVSLLPNTPLAQVIRISTSHCHPAVLAVPAVAPQFAAGAGALGLLALGFVLYRRRRTAADVA